MVAADTAYTYLFHLDYNYFILCFVCSAYVNVERTL